MSVTAVVVSFIALTAAYKTYAADGLTAKVVYNLVVGVICLYGSRISRRLYLSDIGIVREVHSWGRVVRRVLDWDDIRHISVSYRAKQVMYFFEVGDTGWKVPFDRVHDREVREIIADVLPNVEIEKLGG